MNAGARQTYSAAFACPQASSFLICSTAASTEKEVPFFFSKLLSSAVQMTASKCLSTAQSFIVGQSDGEEFTDIQTQPMFLCVVPSRHRRSQMASSILCRLLRHQATAVATPYFLSITSVKAFCLLVEILENSTLRTGPSKDHSSWCSSNSGLTSHMSEPQARIAISSFPSFIRTLPTRRTLGSTVGSIERAARHRQHSWTIHGPN